MTEPTPPAHLRLRGKIDETTCRTALRAALTAAHLFGLAAGTHLRKLRALKDPIATLESRVQEAELRARLAWDAVDILTRRFARIPEGRRPYYTPAQRFQIIENKNLLAWSAQQTAKVFLVCPNTILNWEHSADPNTKTVGSTVQPIPPVRRAADVVRAVVQMLTRFGFGGQDMVHRVLARAGWAVSARSVGRYRRERTITPPPGPSPGPSGDRRITNPVIARFVHHTWMMDVSIVKLFLGPELHVAGVLDAFSRVPLALSVFDRKPGAGDMARLFKMTVKAFAKPKYLITDLGGEFTGGAMVKAVKRLGVIQRFASADNLYATARLERFWRTLKETARLYRLHLPLTRKDLEQRLEIALAHYVLFRPHEGLKGAIPAEAFIGVDPAHLKAVEAPRGRLGDNVADPAFVVEFLGPDRRFPILTRPAA